jgi:CubicO group peptidase (beta-lactamase class C family)
MHFNCLTFIAILLSAAPIAVRADRVDDFVIETINRQRVPGLSLAVVRDGKVVKAQGYGFANVEHQVPAKRETIYQSGSVGKQFTATAVMLLLEDGKLELDEPIRTYLPTTPETWKNVTIRHLLTHTSGASGFYHEINLRGDYTEDQQLQLAFNTSLEFAPGEKWQYSNTGYLVLGVLVSKVSGEFYGDFLTKRIFQPLDMKTARIISEADIISNRAAGYRFVNGELKNQEWVSPSVNTTGDGALYLTIDDMIKWDAALNAEKLLKKNSLNEMWTPAKTSDDKPTNYGFGWFIEGVNGHKVIHHGGAWQGFTTCIRRYVDDRLTVIVLTNAAGPERPGGPGSSPQQIAEGVAAIYEPALSGPDEK